MVEQSIKSHKTGNIKEEKQLYKIHSNDDSFILVCRDGEFSHAKWLRSMVQTFMHTMIQPLCMHVKMDN